MNKKYVVSVINNSWGFFIDKNNESCDCSLENSIPDINTAKQVYDLNNKGSVELREYVETNDLLQYNILQSKYRH